MTSADRYSQYINNSKYAVLIITRKAFYIVPKDKHSYSKHNSFDNYVYVDKATRLDIKSTDKIKLVKDMLFSEKEIVLCQSITDKMLKQIFKGD